MALRRGWVTADVGAAEWIRSNWAGLYDFVRTRVSTNSRQNVRCIIALDPRDERLHAGRKTESRSIAVQGGVDVTWAKIESKVLIGRATSEVFADGVVKVDCVLGRNHLVCSPVTDDQPSTEGDKFAVVRITGVVGRELAHTSRE